MSDRFAELTKMARAEDPVFGAIDRSECLAAARAFVEDSRAAIRERHDAGESGLNVVRMLTGTADALLRGVFDFGLYGVSNRRALLSHACLAALGGYGRSELSPFSDVDVCLLYDGELDKHIAALNDYLVPFLWDVGLDVGYAIRTVSEAFDLAKDDVQVLTSFLEGRLIEGAGTTFSRLKLQVRELLTGEAAASFVRRKITDRLEQLPYEYQDLYNPEPDIKENKGGLRDIHTAQWLLMMLYGSVSLDDVAGLGIITPDEHLDFVQALNFVWRIRNELHFHTGRREDTLSFDGQQHVAKALGYDSGSRDGVHRLMQDYYAAARKLRSFLDIAAGTCHQDVSAVRDEPSRTTRSAVTIAHGQLHAGGADARWFVQQPPRLMEVFWECARNGVTLSRPTARRIADSLPLVGDTFQSNDMVRRFFVAICNLPRQAGFALRQAADAGVLGHYVPEFKAIQGILSYQDFHAFPVDEHSLRAVEALAALDAMEGAVAGCLRKALEYLPDPYILVMAILFHDLGKAEGEIHVEAGVTLVHAIGRRIGMPEEDIERISFLVKHHMLMTNLSQYRDIDDIDIIESFAKTMKTEERLRALFLLSYADLSAVGPNVWNDWKGTLLLKLYLRTEKTLLGRAEALGEEFWKSPKADEVRALVSKELKPGVEEHLRGLGDRYLYAFSPARIAAHMECVARAGADGLAVLCTREEEIGMSEIVVSTRDRAGLFVRIAGAFASQLLDVNGAALFTRPDGYVVDCFTVLDASQRRPLTKRQFAAFENVLRAIIVEGEDVQAFVDTSRRRLFALLQPRIPVRTKIAFDNESSRTYTVIDIETGDRTGLLYDIARAMTDEGLYISASRIVTDAHRVRDSFYVALENAKIEDEAAQARIRERLHRAIHPRTQANPLEGEAT